MCDTKFEFTVGDLAFLGLPMHVQPDGRWRHLKGDESPTMKSFASDGERYLFEDSEDEAAERSYVATNLEGSVSSLFQSDYSGPVAAVRSELVSSETDSDVVGGDERRDEPGEPDDGADNGMTMFHVVFVMNPTELEYNAKLAEMYNYVVRPLAKCLLHEQRRYNYVWKQAQLMLRLREHAAARGQSADELWNNTLTRSSLALALSQIHMAISRASIANVVINSRTRSFQIPIQMESGVLPPVLEPVKVPHFYLTTEDLLSNLKQDSDRTLFDFALLLLDDTDKIITAIQTDAGGPLARFIRLINPTLSLYKIAQSADVPVAEAEKFAKHLIYWRRARAITPIHQRNIYAVAPTAPMKRIRRHARAFARTFPSLPALPALLSTLSNAEPKPFANLIPSRAQRDAYLAAVAWLVRFGYVAQLHTYVFLRVSRAIKERVLHDEIDSIERRELVVKLADHAASLALDERPTPAMIPPRDFALGSPPRRGNRKRFGFIEQPGSPETARAATELERERSSKAREADRLEDSIVLEPDRATALENRWMEELVSGLDPELAALFWKVSKYMNGRSPFQKIPAKEDVTRHEVRRLMSALGDNIIVVRHW
ncbi:nitrogen permease regulator of amino acid transport activity 3-domain-containing protein [Dipodascopsis tothii]|uniref:nitrogen permease regulator of amino acid transport activity 3-domain-containing protein n=1 Tax=Dipodascopsis tothii TaxID=44089 RepID=UPI0034CF60E8